MHRILMRGGVFLYPPTTKNPGGKLRLLYEANPMAMLIEQAGGAAFSGDRRTLEVQPERLHQRVPVVLGSAFIGSFCFFCSVDRILGISASCGLDKRAGAGWLVACPVACPSPTDA